MTSTQPYLQTAGTSFVDHHGQPVRLRGIGIGGWLNMENFITGFPASESMMRAAVLDVLGRDRYELFCTSRTAPCTCGR
jgi:hypothetical protein